MSQVILTLQYPKGLKGLPIAHTTSLSALRHFKHIVLREWQEKIKQTNDDGEKFLYELEFERLKAVLSFFIPEGEGSES